MTDEGERRRAVRARLDAEDWDATYARLRAFASSRCRSNALGEDLAQEALARIYAPDCTWDPAKEPNLLRSLMSTVNSLLANQRTSAAAQRNVSMQSPKASRAVERARDAAAPADEALAREQLHSRRLALLRARLADDADALRTLDLALEGVDAPQEIASAMGRPLKAVAAARLRVQRHATAVAREADGDAGADAPSAREDEEEVA
jgi:DNA-directed RNA polymerase specialized sigma24 family protein